MIVYIGLMLTTSAVAYLAVLLYRNLLDQGGLEEELVTLSPDRRPARLQRQAGYFAASAASKSRTKTVTRRERASKTMSTSNRKRKASRGKSHAKSDGVTRPWGW